MLVLIVGIKLEHAQIIRKVRACVFVKFVKFSDNIQSLRVK